MLRLVVDGAADHQVAAEEDRDPKEDGLAAAAVDHLKVAFPPLPPYYHHQQKMDPIDEGNPDRRGNP